MSPGPVANYSSAPGPGVKGGMDCYCESVAYSMGRDVTDYNVPSATRLEGDRPHSTPALVRLVVSREASQNAPSSKLQAPGNKLQATSNKQSSSSVHKHKAQAANFFAHNLWLYLYSLRQPQPPSKDIGFSRICQENYFSLPTKKDLTWILL